MPTFLRYERVPVWDEDMSDESLSSPATPVHLATPQMAVIDEAAMRSVLQAVALEEAEAANLSHVNRHRQSAHTDHRTNASNSVYAPSHGASGGVAEASAVASGYAASPPDEYGPPKVDMSAPPPYTECDVESREVVLAMPSDGPQQQRGAGVSSNAELAALVVRCGEDAEAGLVQPPSYEEVQRIKAVEAQLESGDHILLPPHTGNLGLTLSGVGGNVSGSEGGAGEGRTGEEDLLGTDLLFFLSFAAAFFFNWVGFVVLVCFCHSVAGRSGALAGFGLSLAKWAVIVRHSTVLAKEANTWILWLIMVLGLVICMRAALQYLNAKREWQHASPASRHRFLLFH